jgi:hypothetical protein
MMSCISDDQTNRLVLVSASHWGQLSANTWKFWVAHAAIYLVSRYLSVICYFVSFTYYSYSLLLFNWFILFWILSPCCILFPIRTPPLFCVSPAQRRSILHPGTLPTEQPERIPGVAGPPSLFMLGIFILCRSDWRWALRWVDLIVSDTYMFQNILHSL